MTVLPGQRPINQTPRSVSTEQVTISEAIGHLMDPVARNNAQGRRPHGFICLHVDDLFMAGDKVFESKVCPVCVRTLRLVQKTRILTDLKHQTYIQTLGFEKKAWDANQQSCESDRHFCFS